MSNKILPKKKPAYLQASDSAMLKEQRKKKNSRQGEKNVNRAYSKGSRLKNDVRHTGRGPFICVRGPIP